MTSKSFEIIAKDKLADAILTNHGEKYIESEIHMVWFCRILGSMKGLFIDAGKNQRYYEVTYNSAMNEMYIDEYEKSRNICYILSDLEA